MTTAPITRSSEPEIVAKPTQISTPPETTPKFVQSNGNYNPKTYETEIKKALGQSSVARLRQTPEGKQDYKDLEQSIHIEIWDAINRYGDKMNSALAYQIASNHVAKFIDKRVKGPKYISLDEPPKDEELEMSDAEMLLAQREIEGIQTWEFSDSSLSSKMGNPRSWMQALEQRGGISTLERLASTWHGTKRLVADAMLRDPEMRVRDLPGVPRSTVSRVRQVVWTEFRKLIRTPLPSTNRDLARKFLLFIKGHGLTMEVLLALPAEKQQSIKTAFLTENKQVVN